MGKRVADVLVAALQAADVKTCYGIVGDTLNRIAHAIDRSEIDWVHVRHEEAGAFAAAAEALFTAVSRPAQARAAPAVFTSSTGSMRLIGTARRSS
jgi:thiamine pyrophosphate-dependent acetolactate synthase large subunit-like protein